MQSKCEEDICNIMYVVHGDKEYLLGLDAREALGIILIKPEG